MRLFAVLAAAIAAAFAALQPTRDATARLEQAYRANNAGVAALERFDYATAATHFRAALAADPTIHIARLNLALALHYGGDSATAAKEAVAVTKALPNEPRAWFVAGLAARAADDAATALTAFERVTAIDPVDVAALTNLGQVYMEAGRAADAIAKLTAATAAEPFNATAAYNLARAFLQSGRAAEGQEAMKRFQLLREAPYAVTYSNTYLQQGRYAEALVSTGSEPNLVNPATPDIAFADVTSASGLDALSSGVESIHVADVTGDERLELLAAGTFGVRLFQRDSNAWKVSAALTSSNAALGVMAGDYDNDGRADVIATHARGVTLWQQTGAGAFENVTATSALDKAFGGRIAALADIDHDGDLDFVSIPTAPAKTLDAWRNNGNRTFVRFDASAGLTAAPDGTVALVPTDFDNRRDVDLIAAGSSGVMLLKNLRDGRFQDVATDAGLREGAYLSVAAGDVNADGRTDFLFGRASAPAALFTSDGTATFRSADAPAGTTGARAAQIFDYDSDGVLDLVTLGPQGLHLLRSTGSSWADATKPAGLADSAPCATGCALVAADLDNDGDTDLLAAASGKLRLLRNGATAARSLAVSLKAVNSNRSAAGARLEMRAGSLLRRVETSISTPSASPAGIVFGLGAREAADVVRVVWPSGIVQAEDAPKPTGRTARLTVTELDRKPSSCPYLFTWNGNAFEFVTDFLGGGEMGYWLAPGVRNVPDPEEYVRITSDKLVASRGSYELRVTNELEEALFIDRLSLIAVTHPEGTHVFPNEGLFAPPYPSHRLFITRGAQPPAKAVDDRGTEVRALVERVDRRAPGGFELERFRGYARDHFVEITIPARQQPQLLLLLTAWTDYAFSSDNVAAAHAGLSLKPPSLDIAGRSGTWRPIVDNIGIPVGRPQTVVVDLTDRVPLGELRLRLRTNMRIYWDQILYSTSPSEAVERQSLATELAKLRWRGFSAEVSPDGREPFGYDYARVSLTSPWKLMPGRYTREGDVRELLAAADDRFVVSRPGDEIALSFAALPPPRPGWTRTFLLHADGFSKEMDRNSASPDVAAPLPYHGMTTYPYDPAARPMTAADRAYVDRYNTRVVARTIPVLVAEPTRSPR